MEKFVKPWRNRSKIVSNAGTALWTPKGDFRWSSAGGATVVLTETTLSELSKPERRALQRLALLKLQTLSINCTIPSYKGEGKHFGKRLRRSLHRRKRSGDGNLSLLSRIGGVKGKTGVFATPLEVLIKNDRLGATNVRHLPRQTRRKSEPTALSAEARERAPRRRRASSNTPPSTSALKRQNIKQTALRKNSSSTSSLRSAGSSVDGGDFPPVKRHSDSDSILISDLYAENARRTAGWKSQLLDALTLSSTSASASCLYEKPELPIPSPPQVPSIVVQSIKYLEKHGLHALGIFRVAGSKKRLKQLRDEFDSGLRESFSQEDNAHDVAALFKEFLRCLPEPLLTRELYTSFLSTQRFRDTETQLNALRYLWYLLPDSNRDTLQCLLSFLGKVAKCAEDTTDENDQIIPGNKMNCRNLATLMGPNILHKMKSSHQHNYVVENFHRAEENDEVIDVTEDLINYHEQLSIVSPEMHDQVMRLLVQSEPETVDFILRRKKNRSHLGEDIENIIKGSTDIINDIDDKETNARLTHRSNSVDMRTKPVRTQSVPASNKKYTSTQALRDGQQPTSDPSHQDPRFHARCASVDAQFVKSYGLNPRNCTTGHGEKGFLSQRSYGPLYTHSEPPTPKMNSSSSFSYFTPPPSPDSIPLTSSTGNSPNSSPRYSPTADSTCHKCGMQENNGEVQNGQSFHEDSSSVSESKGESDMTSEDFDDGDMRRQWLEWEAISKNFTDEDFLEQETLV